MRIQGLETEYGCIAVDASGASKKQEQVSIGIISECAGRSNVRELWTRNGSRLYIDVGAILEYATSEAPDARSVVKLDLAGDLMLSEAAAALETKLRESWDEGAKVRIYKNNDDGKGSCWGSHENLSVDRSVAWEVLVRELAGHLTSRIIWSGAGKVRDGRYMMSARAQWIGSVEHAGTTCIPKPLINTRDEPLTNTKNLRRLHIVGGESNVMQVPLFLRFGTTDLLLCAIEQQKYIPENLILENPVAALKDINRDLSLRQLLVTKTGAKMTAVNLQEAYVEHVEKNVHDMDQVQKQVFSLWQEVVSGLKTDPESQVGRVEWLAKKSMIDRALKQPGRPGATQRLEMAWHDISEERGVAKQLTKRGLLDTVVEPGEAEYHRTHGCAGTRGAVRAALINEAENRNLSYRALWMSFSLGGFEAPEWKMGDARQGNVEAGLGWLEKVTQTLEKHEEGARSGGCAGGQAKAAGIVEEKDPITTGTRKNPSNLRS